jgi:hypothetical protein
MKPFDEAKRIHEGGSGEPFTLQGDGIRLRMEPHPNDPTIQYIMIDLMRGNDALFWWRSATLEGFSRGHTATLTGIKIEFPGTSTTL